MPEDTVAGVAPAGELDEQVRAALAKAVAEAITQNPEAARQFATAFQGEGAGEVAAQWLTYEINQKAGDLDRLVPESVPDDPPEQPVLSWDWVTDEQREQLEQIPRGDDWTDWLPGQLDDRRPDWRGMTNEKRHETLDLLLPLLALPDEIDEEEMDQAVRQFIAEVLEPTLRQFPGAEDASDAELTTSLQAAFERVESDGED